MAITDSQVGHCWKSVKSLNESDSVIGWLYSGMIKELIEKLVEERREYLLLCCKKVIHHDCDHLEEARKEFGIT